MKRILIVLTSMMILGCSTTAFAGYEYNSSPNLEGNYEERIGYWVQDDIGWKWIHEDGSFLKSGLYILDGNEDEVYEYYCFDENGYMYHDVTIPPYNNGKLLDENSTFGRYTYNSEGQWINDHDVETLDGTKPGESYRLKHVYNGMYVNFGSNIMVVDHAFFGRYRIGIK